MGSVVGELTGANKAAARNAGRAAAAQQAEAKKFLTNQQGLAGGISEAMNNPEALMMQEQALNTQSRQLERDEELIGSINPALKEAATQALSLLKGEKAASLGPMEQDRQRKRDKLLNQLREQLGPGAETSSAGQQALQNFDNETSTILGNAQQSSLSSLLGTAMNSRPTIGASANNLLNFSNAGLDRSIQGANAQSNLTSPAFQSLMGNAGAPFVEGQVRAQQKQRLGGELFGAASTAFGAGMFGDMFGGLGGGGVETPSVGNFVRGNSNISADF